MGEYSENIMSVERAEGQRRKCPKCGNESINKIHESLDKTRIINDYPKMYGKKYKCGMCGQEWREV